VLSWSPDQEPIVPFQCCVDRDEDHDRQLRQRDGKLLLLRTAGPRSDDAPWRGADRCGGGHRMRPIAMATVAAILSLLSPIGMPIFCRLLDRTTGFLGGRW